VLAVLRFFANMSGDHCGLTEDVVSGERLFVVEGVSDIAAACRENVACTGRLCCCCRPNASPLCTVCPNRGPARPLLSFFLTSTMHAADHSQGVATKQRHEKASAKTHSNQVSPAAISSSHAKSSECSMQQAVTMLRLHQPAESQSAAHQTAAPDSRKRLALELPHSDKRRQSQQNAASPMSHSACAQEDPSGSVTADNASDRDSDTDDEPEVPH